MNNLVSATVGEGVGHCPLALAWSIGSAPLCIWDVMRGLLSCPNFPTTPLPVISWEEKQNCQRRLEVFLGDITVDSKGHRTC